MRDGAKEEIPLDRLEEIPLDRLEAYVIEEAQHSDAPKYVCVLEAFNKGIRLGDFKPGERVPTETALSKRLPVSLGTLQKALGKLTDNGMLVRNRKTGTFIADRRSQSPEVNIYRFKDPATGDIQLPFTKVVHKRMDQTDGPWSKTLAGEQLVRIDRLVWIDGEPPAFNSVYIAHKYGKHLLDQPARELNGSSYHRILMERFNLPTLRMEHEIGCRSLTPKACKHLKLEPGTVGTVWDITNHSFHDEAYLFQRFQLPPGHRPIEIEEVSKR